MIQILDNRTNFHIVDDLLGVSSISAGPQFEFIALLAADPTASPLDNRSAVLL